MLWRRRRQKLSRLPSNMAPTKNRQQIMTTMLMTIGPKLCRAALWVSLVTLGACSGCGGEQKKSAPSLNKPPVLHVMHPQFQMVSHVVGQPSFVQSYERTSIYPKMTAYIEKWNVDIGDRVRKGDVVAELFVPELRELWGTKKATVAHDKERLAFATKEVDVADADMKAAAARMTEAEKMLDAYKAKVDRWVSEVNRLSEEVRKKVVAPQILLESQMQLKADMAEWDAQQATVERTQKDLLAKTAALEAAQIDVGVARTRVEVSESESRRLQALVGYLKLFAPYDGIIIGAMPILGISSYRRLATPRPKCGPRICPPTRWRRRSTSWIARILSAFSSIYPNETPITCKLGPRPRSESGPTRIVGCPPP